MIGRPLTDVPELCPQVLIMTDGDPVTAICEAIRLAEEFWSLRHRMQAKLVPIKGVIPPERTIESPLVFTDAADATSSGAKGDPDELVKAPHRTGYRGRVIAQIADPAAAATHRVGVGTTIEVTFGGAHDRARSMPWPVTAEVALPSNARATVENRCAAECQPLRGADVRRRHDCPTQPYDRAAGSGGVRRQ